MAQVHSLIPFSLLIVEDDTKALNVIARMIPNKFPTCTIYTANNGNEGLELFRQFAPDIVVTDVNMPGMEGFEMITRINLINAGTPIIVLTAYSDKITYEKLRDLSVSKYLLKPLDLNELFAEIEKCRAGKKPPSEQYG